MFIAFWTTRFLQETIRISPNSPMVRWSALLISYSVQPIYLPMKRNSYLIRLSDEAHTHKWLTLPSLLNRIWSNHFFDENNVTYFWYDFQKWPMHTYKFLNHIRIVFGSTLYFIPINRNRNFIPVSELAQAACRRDGPSHFHCIRSNHISYWENVCLLKRDWSSSLQAKSILTSLQRLEICILSVSAQESCVCWGVSRNALPQLARAPTRSKVKHLTLIVIYRISIKSCWTFLLTLEAMNPWQDHGVLHSLLTIQTCQ